MSASLLPILCLWLIWFASQATTEATSTTTSTVHIVYMERTLDSTRTTESKNVHTLAAVLGSEEAARKAIIYTYRNVINGFSALLTTSQVDALSKQPGVLKILPAPMDHLQEGLVTSSP